MAAFQELSEGREERIDYEELISRFPWIVERNQHCILSPDSDGLLCGLFMSHVLGWQIKGFYDGKIMVLEKGVSLSECIFLNVDVFGKGIRSVRHHMVLYNKNDIPEKWDNFDNCIQPNNMRGYDGLHTFRLKHPLATIHLLMGIVGSQIKVEVPELAICPLLFAGRTYRAFCRCPQKVLYWLKYLRADEEGSPIKTVFVNETYSVGTLMKAMAGFLRKRDEITIRRECGDKLRLSSSDGSPYNIVATGDTYRINEDAVNRIERFIEMLAKLTGWNYRRDVWSWANMDMYRFTKQSFEQDGLNVNGLNFRDLL